MADRRRYTGTRILQVAWTVLVVALVVLLETGLSGLVSTPLSVAGGSTLWLCGLIALGLRERRHWNRLVTASSFDRGVSGHTADLQTIVRGKSVTVTSDVTGLFAPEHTGVRAPVEGVDASFRVRIVDDELTSEDGLTTGDEALDARFTITGSESNVAAILTRQMRDALLAVDAPGTYTVGPDSVVFEVPFTHLQAEELAAASEAVAMIALRVEDVGQG